MSEALMTLEGWYALHDFRSVNWPGWKSLTDNERGRAMDELIMQVREWAETEEQKRGSTVLYSIVGQKADLLIVHLRETLEELNELETKLNKSMIGDVLDPVYSYVSIVELSSYMGKPGSDPMANPEIAARLRPIMPKTRHICFYPMNKKRDGADNWYMLSMEQRREMMRSHGMIGRQYAGKVKQIITGSVGLDDWEWGVTLFADDALQFKKLVYEMRFDEVSARFGEFGEFYVGNLLDENKLKQLLTI
jgi:chlorite dismutase